MSNFRYKQVGKFDFENRFKAIFNGNTGFYMRSGILERDEHGKLRDTNIDPFMASFPELIDIGIMERCICSNKCNVDCYQRACDRTGENMKLEDFKWIIEQCKERVFQVALGGAGDPDTHENFDDILKVCANANIVPNFTTSGIALTEEKVKLCKEYCGAVAVSEHFSDYTDKAVEMLVSSGVKTNVHYVLSKNTISKAINILNGEDKYRNGINAIVFLIYKPVGLGKEENVLHINNSDVKDFFNALDNRKCNFKVGFDSCSCSGLLNFAHSYSKKLIDFCEGARFSMYISADMQAMPCSFANQNKDWHVTLSNNCNIKEAWNSEIFERFRNSLRFNCKDCKDRQYCGGGCPLIKSVSLCDRQERSTYDK